MTQKNIEKEALPFYFTPKEYQKRYRDLNLSFFLKNKIKHYYLYLKDILTSKHIYRSRYDLEKKAFNLLNDDELLKFSLLLKNGYIMPKEQELLYEYKISYYIDQNAWEILNLLIKEGLILPINIIKHIFYHFSFQIYCHSYLISSSKEQQPSQSVNSNTLVIPELNEKYTYLAPLIKDFVLGKEGLHVIFSDWLQIIKNISYHDKTYLPPCVVYYTFDFFEKNILHELSQEQLTFIRDDLDLYKTHLILLASYSSDISHIDTCIKKLDTMILSAKSHSNIIINNERHAEQDFNQLINQTKNIYKKDLSLDKPYISGDEFKQNYFKDEYLPTKIKQILFEISHIYDKILSGKELVDVNTLLEVERLMKQRIPEMLKKYQAIDEQLVTQHFQTSKQPLDILYQALNDIYDVFFNIHLNLTERQISDLNASYRYTQAIKNGNYEQEQEY